MGTCCKWTAGPIWVIVPASPALFDGSILYVVGKKIAMGTGTTHACAHASTAIAVVNAPGASN